MTATVDDLKRVIEGFARAIPKCGHPNGKLTIGPEGCAQLTCKDCGLVAFTSWENAKRFGWLEEPS